MIRFAAQEYESAFTWYDERSSKTADNFVLAVERTIELICVHPDRYRNTYNNFREISLSKYPFSIVYYFDSVKKVVVIISIYHHKRDPQWKFTKPK